MFLENMDMMGNKIIGSYKNGNYEVIILEDGTKIRITEDEKFVPTRLESTDCKITNFCDMNCRVLPREIDYQWKTWRFKQSHYKHISTLYRSGNRRRKSAFPPSIRRFFNTFKRFKMYSQYNG